MRTDGTTSVRTVTAPMLKIQIKVPGFLTYEGIFPSQQAATADAEQRFPQAWAVQTRVLRRPFQ
ncbi:MAG: hypothetical protein J0H69_19635 [Burkholderiales bacterium]|nr:hypothetical protein [Burkholderiales bacterium]